MNITMVNNCTACFGCVNKCPAKAISIDDSGLFYKPMVDTQKCVDCSLCLNICPVIAIKQKNEVLSAYAGWSKTIDVVRKSSSGGVFHELAKLIIDAGGVAFGAVFSENSKKVIFDNSDNVSLNKLQKSKYVESLTFDTYNVVESYLEKGRAVLFCGTPCQIAGLKSFIPKTKQKMLFTIDFACGGLPSHKIYHDYLDHLENKYKAKILSVDFRPKTYGWKHYAILIKFDNGDKYNKLLGEDSYMRLFLNGRYSVRSNCLNCMFSDNHYSDITIADFWRHAQLSDLQNDDGISLILCNTEKGKELVERIKPSFELKQVDTDIATYNNKPTLTSEAKMNEHKAFIEYYEKNGFESACKKYVPNSIMLFLRSKFARIKYKRVEI